MKKFTDNYIDLSCLPKTSRGIDWQNINHLPVKFKYRGIEDVLYIEKHINKDDELISYKGNEFIINKYSLVNAALGKIFNFKVHNNYKYKVGETIERDNKPTLKVLELSRSNCKSHHTGAKSYKMLCLECNSIFVIREGNLNKGDGCPYCSNHKVRKGFNDVFTTHPEIVEYLFNKEDAYNYTARSNKQVKTQCPICHTYLGLHSLDDIYTHRIRCPKCGKGNSYPNRFMFNLLRELDIPNEHEVQFPWCTFHHFTDPTIIIRGRYDFVCPNHNLIIEMDSGLGHGNNIHTKAMTSEAECLYRDSKKEQLAYEHGFEVIRINCEYYGHEDRFMAVKEGILNSNFSNYFDLSNVNWHEIDIQSQSSLLKEICKYYTSGSNTKEIAEIVGLTVPTVRVYLHKGTECGLCNYTHKYTKPNKRR